jgi:hypothetical protein
MKHTNALFLWIIREPPTGYDLVLRCELSVCTDYSVILVGKFCVCVFWEGNWISG